MNVPPRPSSLSDLPYRPNKLENMPTRPNSLSVFRLENSEVLNSSNPKFETEKKSSSPMLSQPSFIRTSKVNLLKSIGKASSVVVPTLSTMVSPSRVFEDGKATTAPFTLKFINSRAHLEPLYQHFFNVTNAKSLRFFLIFPIIVITLYIAIDYLYYFSTMKETVICRVLIDAALASTIVIAHFFPTKISYVIPFLVYIGLILLAWVDLIWGTDGYEPILQICLWGGFNIPGGVSFYNIIMGLFFIPTHAILYILYGKQQVSQVLIYQSLTFLVFLIGSNNLKMEARHREIFLSLHDIVVGIKSKTIPLNPPKISIMVNDSTATLYTNTDPEINPTIPNINTNNIITTSSPHSLSFRELASSSPAWRAQPDTPKGTELEEFSTNAKVEFSKDPTNTNQTPTQTNSNSNNDDVNTNNSSNSNNGSNTNNSNSNSNNSSQNNTPPSTTRPSSIRFHPAPLESLSHLDLEKNVKESENKEPTLEDIMRVYKAMNLFLSKQRNRLTCNFHRDSLEKEYRRFYTQISDQGLLLFFTFTVGSFCLFVIHDLNFMQKQWLDLAIGLRFGVIVPLSFSILSTVLIQRLRIFRIQLITFVLLALGGCYCVMLYFSQPVLPAFNIYYGSIMRVISYGVSGLLLPFTYSAFSSILITIAYFIVMVLKDQSAISIILIMLWGPALSRQYDGVLRMKFILDRRPEMLREYIAMIMSSSSTDLDKNSKSLQASLVKWEQAEQKSVEKVPNDSDDPITE